MLYEDFNTLWLIRRWGVWCHAIVGVGFLVLLVCSIIIESPRWLVILEGCIFWINLYLAAINWAWFKKRWIVYTIDDTTYVDEENQEIYNFIELEEYQLCQVQSTGQDESDVMTS